MSPLTALIALNRAAYAAVYAAKSDAELSNDDRQALRDVARETDRILDQNSGRLSAA